MIRVTRSVHVPDGRRHNLYALQEKVLGVQIFLVENLDYGKNSLGHILFIKLSEVLWDKEMSERIPGQIPPWLLFTATNFAANSCAPCAPSEHLLNNFKYIIIPPPLGIKQTLKFCWSRALVIKNNHGLLAVANEINT